jgi:multidrug efflux pump subunit AcrA (membrane-fusion protein)
MSTRVGGGPVVYALGALSAGAIVAAVLVVGPASGQQTASTRTITARRGVVQSTVSGSGNVEAASQLDLGFKTSGTITQIYVTQGEHVGAGQLLATLDPQSAEVTLEQAKASLQSAEASLAREEETDGESSGAGGSTGASDDSSSASQPKASAARAGGAPAAKSAPSKRVASTRGAGTTTSSTGKRKGSSGGGSQGSSSGGQGSGGEASSSSTGTTGTSISAATRAANISSARAAVKSDRLTVLSDEQAVADTRLVAPQSGTIVSLSGEVGETVSGGGTSRAPSQASEESSSATAATGRGSTAASSSSGASGSGSSSSSPFAVLSDLSSMKLVVPLSESEVGSVKPGQTATVTVEALKSAKLAAHVSEVAALATSDSGVVSYDVTFVLDQMETGLKPGMSATAEVVVAQAEGVNVPTSAISGGAVTVVHGGKQERRAVTAGLAGNSSTILLSGLNAGEQVALPLASTGGTSSLLSRLAGRGGTGTLGGGALGGAGGLGGSAFPGVGFTRRAGGGAGAGAGGGG